MFIGDKYISSRQFIDFFWIEFSPYVHARIIYKFYLEMWSQVLYVIWK